MTEVMTRCRGLLSGLLFVVAASYSGMSAGEGSAITLTVTLTVISEPCTINGGNPVVVDFGDDLLTTQVDGSNYMKNIDYTLDCSEATADDLKMTITGTGAGFDDTVLQADQADLGIKLLSDNKAMPLNQPLNFSRGMQPVLQAVPVKNPSGKLVAGAFTASATMTVEYQ